MNQYQPIYRKSKTSMPSTHRYHHSNTISIQTKNSDLENLNKNPIDSTTFRIPSTESLENKLAILRRSTVNRTECNKEEQNDNSKLSQLERDREYLILKNIELENEINKLDSMFNNTITSLNKEKKKEIQEEKTNKKVSLLEENVKLRKKVKELQKIISDLEIRAEKNKGKSDIRYEIKLWKERTIELGENFKTTLSEIKKELNKDKMAFKLSIKKIQDKYNKDVKELYNFYSPQMIKNEKKLQLLIKENADLHRKENKLKEVFMYNFN